MATSEQILDIDNILGTLVHALCAQGRNRSLRLSRLGSSITSRHRHALYQLKIKLRTFIICHGRLFALCGDRSTERVILARDDGSSSDWQFADAMNVDLRAVESEVHAHAERCISNDIESEYRMLRGIESEYHPILLSEIGSLSHAYL